MPTLLSSIPGFIPCQGVIELDAQPVNGSLAIPNFLETSFPEANNDLYFEQVGDIIPTIEFEAEEFFIGSLGNRIEVTGNVIKCIFVSSFGSFSMAPNDFIDIYEASSEAMSLALASNKSGNDGTNPFSHSPETPIVFGPTSLSGGSPEVTGTPASFLYQTANHNGDIYICINLSPFTWEQVVL